MLREFWVMASVKLHSPSLLFDESGKPDEDGPLPGYYRTFGVTAASSKAAREMVVAAVDDGEIDWADSEISSIVPESLAAWIVEKSGDWTREGIWFESGRIFYPYSPMR
jgi:hypothetical protein